MGIDEGGKREREERERERERERGNILYYYMAAYIPHRHHTV